MALDSILAACRELVAQPLGSEGCRWKEAFVHPRDAHGVLIFLGNRTPVVPGPERPLPG